MTVSTRAPWIERLRRDVLDPMRRLAVAHPFYRQIADGSLPRPLLRRYVSDTLWAVRDFAAMAVTLACEAPPQHADFMAVIAEEETDHPALLGRAVEALGGDVAGIMEGNYFPTPTYALWWRTVQDAVAHRPWVEGIAVVMVGIEDLARVQEAMVGDGMRAHYGLSAEQAAWFTHHGGPEEAEHGSLGLQILEQAVDAADEATQARLRGLVEATAIPLLFDYPSQMLGLELADDETLDSRSIDCVRRLGIPFRLIRHPKGTRTAQQLAALAGLPVDRVFKTILLRSAAGEYVLCSVPCLQQIDVAKVAALAGTEPLELATRDEVESVAGYRGNTVCAFGMRCPVPYYVDPQLFDDAQVYLGSGVAGVDLAVAVADLLRTLHPICADIVV